MDGTHRRGLRSIISSLTLCAAAALGIGALAGCGMFTESKVDNPYTPDVVDPIPESMLLYERERHEARLKRQAEEEASEKAAEIARAKREFEIAVLNLEADSQVSVRELQSKYDLAVMDAELSQKRIERIFAAAVEESGRLYGAARTTLEEKRAQADLWSGLIGGAIENPATMAAASMVPGGAAALSIVGNLWQMVSASRRRREAEAAIARERIEKAEALRLAEIEKKRAEDVAWEESKKEQEAAVVKRDENYAEGEKSASAAAMTAAMMQILASIVPAGAKPAGTT